MTTSSKQDFLSIAAAGSALALIKFGLGGVPFGNEFEVVSDEDAYKTLEAAWNAGVRYYDVAPWYGLGLAERRYGNFLHNKSRDGYVLSSKVGKLLKPSPHNNAKSNFPFSPSPNNVVFDYTADGVQRSIEDSLQRMGVSRLLDRVIEKLATSDKVTLVVERLQDGKMRVTSNSWEGEKVFFRDQSRGSLGRWAPIHVSRKVRKPDEWDPGRGL